MNEVCKQPRYEYLNRFPHLPCLQAGQKKDRLLPMEVCTLIPGAKRYLSELQTANMIKYTAVPAPQRKANIEKWVSIGLISIAMLRWDGMDLVILFLFVCLFVCLFVWGEDCLMHRKDGKEGLFNK